jgi:hypothetical protein
LLLLVSLIGVIDRPLDFSILGKTKALQDQLAGDIPRVMPFSF